MSGLDDAGHLNFLGVEIFQYGILGHGHPDVDVCLVDAFRQIDRVDHDLDRGRAGQVGGGVGIRSQFQNDLAWLE